MAALEVLVMYRSHFVTFAFYAVIAVAPLHAGFIMNFDENGNGTISINGGPFQTFNGSLIPDPTSTLGNVLAWQFAPLGITFNEGDGLILDPGGAPSDELRFTNSQGGLSGGFVGNILIFYSSDTSGGLLADTGLAGNPSAIDATEDATGHFTYIPSPNTYNGFSGAVPEPAMIIPLGLALFVLAVFAHRRQSSLIR
jgi:hypothetical protein